MNYEDAKNLITNVLNNQRFTIAEHTQAQQAWKAIVELADQTQAMKAGNKYGDDAVPISGAVQPSQ